jgi:GH24 family phage-related lysozyme (muramidase)
MSAPQFGVQDSTAAQSIDRSNAISSSRERQAYDEVVRALDADLARFAANPYALARIRNELADVLTYQSVDLERAITLDEQLAAGAVPDTGAGTDFVPAVRAANNRILGGDDYLKTYVTVKGAEIRERSRERLARNRSLVKGQMPGASRRYTRAELQENVAAVKADLARNAGARNIERTLLSRLFKSEHALTEVDAGYRLTSQGEVLARRLTVEDVDGAEIDFLTYSDFLTRAFRQTGEVAFARLALEAVYGPYARLRAASNRWHYNALVNGYISTLVAAHHKAGNHVEMLYYSSLNKSRMVLEERLLLSPGKGHGETIGASLASGDGIKRGLDGLPDRAWFSGHIAQLGDFVDFYVDGTYTSGGTGTHGVPRTDLALDARDFGAEKTARAGVFSELALYITVIRQGRIVSVSKLESTEVEALKRELDQSTRQIAANQSSGKRVALLTRLATDHGLSEPIGISTDKWVSRHPMAYYIGAVVVRSVNAFTYRASPPLDRIEVAGLFNPTLDLPGSDIEADALARVVPGAKLARREAARLAALESAAGANIVHLSMHGAFNEKDPKASKLLLHGAKPDFRLGDPNALYASDIPRMTALRGRDLVFAAACQTGLTGSDKGNRNELLGMLRYLTANSNRNVILSLWTVDDEATSEFVTAFYGDLAVSRDVVKAFATALRAVRQKYTSPYYWAAFYLSTSN